MQCSICGRQFNENYQKTEQDLRNEKAMQDSGFPMDVTINFDNFTKDSKLTAGSKTTINENEDNKKEDDKWFYK